MNIQRRRITMDSFKQSRLPVLAIPVIIVFCYIYVSKKQNTNKIDAYDVTLDKRINEPLKVTFKENSNIIIAFGDSLTEGYVRDGGTLTFHPYTNELQELINKHSTKTNLTVINKGVSGEKAVNMPTRLKKILEQQNILFVIILAGTNDYIGLVRTLMNLGTTHQLLEGAKQITSTLYSQEQLTEGFEKIYNDIIKLHNICHEKNIRTAVITMPEIKFEERSLHLDFLKGRIELNDKLRKFSMKNKDQTVFIDLATEMPYIKGNLNFRNNFWCKDGLHFTPLGYAKMGKLIYAELKEKNVV